MDHHDRSPRGLGDNAEVEHRLRQLGSAPLPEHLAELPVGAVAPVIPVAPAGSRSTRRTWAAAAAVLALAGTGGLAYASATSSGGGLVMLDAPPDQVAPADGAGPTADDPLVPATGDDGDGDGDDVLDDPDGDETEVGDDRDRWFPHLDDPCKGPPEFVTDPTDDPDVHRSDEARAHAETRAACPDRDGDEGTGDEGTGDEGSDDEGTGDETASGTADDSRGAFPHLDDPCKGPPEFVTDPTTDPSVHRADEARAHAEIRAACPDGPDALPDGDGSESDTDTRPRGTPDHAPGPPEHAPGPPERAPGPPDHAGGSDRTPGPPDHAGRPDPAPGASGRTPGPPDHAPGPPAGRPGAPSPGDD